MTAEQAGLSSPTVTSFDSIPFAPFLQETIRTVGYTTPTPIQANAIPLILEGRDLIGLAQTGTGKTAAFVLPLLQQLSGSKKKGVQALILAPTRELAEQINDVIKTFSGRTGVRTVTVYGGVSHRNQISQLRTNVQVVVACPGRLMDHIRGKTIDLSGVDYLILDEADRMLDMGFMPDIKAIIAKLPAERQTMLFSATMPDEIAQLTKSYLREPETVRVRSEQPVALVTHSMLTVNQEEKSERLASWLRANPDALAVVFTKMKHTAKRLGDRLTKDGVPATSLHGNLSQAQRQKALQGFRDGRFRALIATDIASRGIDVEGVTHVLNYDMPETLEAYIHRTGRAGRASREGSAVSFVTRGDRFILRDVEKWLKTPLIRLNAESEDSSEEQPRQRSRSADERGGRQPRGRDGGRAGARGPRPGARAGARAGDRGGAGRTERRGRSPEAHGDGASERPNQMGRQWRSRRDEGDNRGDFRGGSKRSFSGDSRGRSFGGARQNRSGDREFRGQADIDPKADFVYREREPYFIDRGEGTTERGNRKPSNRWGGRGASNRGDNRGGARRSTRSGERAGERSAERSGDARTGARPSRGSASWGNRRSPGNRPRS